MYSEYTEPMLDFVFLRYTDHEFTQGKAKFNSLGSGRRTTGRADYGSAAGWPAQRRSGGPALSARWAHR
jgi:hypothetical protein